MGSVHEPVLIHVGFVKTATTFLQRKVFSGTNGELELAAGAETRAQTVQNILLADDYTFDPAGTRARMEAIAAPVRARGKLPVWSEEMLLGNPPSGRYDGFSNARKAKAAYPDARVLITIRRQQSIALSMYREYVLGGGALPIRCFIGTGDEPISHTPILRPEFLCFDRAIGHYRELFGPERVLVLPQEMLADDPPRYLAALSEFTGRPIMSDLQPGREHVGEGYPALVLRRAFNRLTVLDPTRPGRRGLAAVTNRIVRLFNRLTPAALNAALLRRYERTVEARYPGLFADSNRETAAMTGLPLADYGYDL